MEELGKLLQKLGLAEAALTDLRLLCQKREECGQEDKWNRKKKKARWDQESRLKID